MDYKLKELLHEVKYVCDYFETHDHSNWEFWEIEGRIDLLRYVFEQYKEMRCGDVVDF